MRWGLRDVAQGNAVPWRTSLHCGTNDMTTTTSSGHNFALHRGWPGSAKLWPQAAALCPRAPRARLGGEREQPFVLKMEQRMGFPLHF
jgi:hypothetical protein